MKITQTMIFMFIGSFIVQYFLMPPIMVSNYNYVTNNIGKAYLASIMGITMVIIEIMMHDNQYGVLSLNLYAILFALLAILIYLYRKQIYINDKQYLEGMIEHHSMALFTSNEILKKSDNYDVTKLAKNIISQQSDELRVMKDLLYNKI
jgi:Ca2+/Na+ antiporter